MTKRSVPYPLLIVPGLGGSEPAHWQSHWIETFAGAERVVQLDWDRPNLSLWLYQLLARVERRPGAILVGHSLGCILVAHLAQRQPQAKIAGALLVAPADVDVCVQLAGCVASFKPTPLQRLPFPSAVVASTNDAFVTLDRAAAMAEAWGSRFHNVGARGHINVAAGFGPWPEGEDILDDLCTSVQAVGNGPAPSGLTRKQPAAWHRRRQQPPSVNVRRQR